MTVGKGAYMMGRTIKVLLGVTAIAGLLPVLALASCNGGEKTSEVNNDVTATPKANGGGTIAGLGILVDSTGDSDSRDGAITLREAIMLASGVLAVVDLDSQEADNIGGTPGAQSTDTISFDTSIFPLDAPATIRLASSLPVLSTGSDTIDGSAAGVIIDGSNQGFDCLEMDSSGNTIKGLQIQNCRTAIVLKAAADNNTIGGSTEDARNIISSNDGVGIEIGGKGNSVLGNYIGTDPSGTESRPNRMEGIWIAPGGQDNIIGGSSPAERNLISGNALFGLAISGSGATGNVVKGNYIGVDATGQVALRNRYGLVISGGAQNNIIGGSDPDDANIISGNQSSAVLIRHPDTRSNLLIGNHIGLGADGTVLTGYNNGTGIWILDGPQDNKIGSTTPGDGNVIAGSRGTGVLIGGANTTGNQIRGNSIHSNIGQGIVNKDGGNLQLAPPVISSVGPVTGTACPNCTVDIYSDSEDEGEVYEGSTVADTNGRFTLDKTLSGPFATATATDADGNTSSFSTSFAVFPQ